VDTAAAEIYYSNTMNAESVMERVGRYSAKLNVRRSSFALPYACPGTRKNKPRLAEDDGMHAGPSCPSSDRLNLQAGHPIDAIQTSGKTRMKTKTSTAKSMKTSIHHISRQLVGSLCVTLSAYLLIGMVHAGYVDITVNDGGPSSYYGSDPRPGVGESGQVAANCVADPSWDLRAMAFDINTNKLMVVSGLNPLTKNGNFGIGDIFIDTNNSFTVPSRPSSSDGYLTYSNSSAGYEYAIDLIDPASGNLNYNVVALSGASSLKSGYYAQNAVSDPATLSASGADTILSNGVFSVTTRTDTQVLAEFGLNIGTNGGTNYVFSFDLSAASLANGATFRLTTECGNDLLVGQLSPSASSVPETSTWVMGLLALGAVVIVARLNTALSRVIAPTVMLGASIPAPH